MRLSRLCALVSAALVATAAVAAAKCPEPGAGMLFERLLLLGLVLVNAPLSLARLRPRGVGRASAYAGWSLFLWAALSVLGLAPVWRMGAPRTLADVLLFAGALPSTVCAVRSALRGRRSGGAGLTAAALGALVLFGLSAGWGADWTSLSMTARETAGGVHVDHYYHSGIVDCLVHFGRVSIAIDGLTFTKTHFLSHLAFAGLAKLCGLTGIEVYQLAYPLLLPLLYVFALAFVLRRLDPRWSASAAVLASASLATFLLPESALGKVVLWDPLLSESHGVGAVLFLLGISTTPAVARRLGAGRPGVRETVAGAAWTFLLGMCKISFGVIAGAAVGLAAFVRFLKDRRVSGLAKGALATAAFLATLPFVYEPRGTKFQILYFIRWYGAWGWKTTPLFMLLHWMTLWIGVAAVAARVGRKDLPKALASDPWAVLVLAPALAFGALAVNLTIYMGSSYYFTSLPAILAVPWALSKLRGTRLSPAVLAAAVAVAALPAWAGRAKGVMTRVVRGRVEARVTPAASDDYRALLARRAELSPLPCAVALDPWWLTESGIGKEQFCSRVPFQFSGILGRPLVESRMPRACREGETGYIWQHPQGERLPNDPKGPAACEQAKASGLTCVEYVTRSSVEKRDCP